jgi:HK97 family phage prohead protease
MKDYDFSGWATRNNLRCSDGRTIMRDAFKDCDGLTVPLVWNHKHGEAINVLGHALLENRDEGVYTYGVFNDTDEGRHAKELVKHGDITALSIYANQLKEKSGNVLHGAIREVSLVLAGANPGAFIDSVMQHGEECEGEAIIYTGEDIELSHSDENASESDDSLSHADDKKDGSKVAETKNKEDKKDEKTVQDVIDSMNEEQKTVMYALIGQALEGEDDGDEEEIEHSEEGGNDTMKHNVFDNDAQEQSNVLTHSDQEAILSLAKSNSVGSLRDAMEMYVEDNTHLAHGIDDIESLFPEYKDVYPGAPEFIQRDQGWVTKVMAGVHKSPISRIRTRQADITGSDLRAYGYGEKGKEKKQPGNIKLLKRTTDPQTVYRKDSLHRDDIIDITDFDVVEYQYQVMKQNLNEELAMAIMIGDGREDGDEMKIDETHIRPIWTDDELYTIHADVDVASAKAELQGSNTSANFGENYIYAEAIITAALYAREKYKGSGNLEFYCTPHLLNVMLLARDLNGRRIYSSKADLEAALNVTSIQTAEQFEGKTRTTTDSKQKKLLGLFINLSDYQVGSTKGGEITRFNQFDIDFNQEKYLIETRLSGALIRVKSAIALEEPVNG